MAHLRLFASAREVAGTSRDTVHGSTVGEVLTIASERFGPSFDEVLRSCKVWVNGEAADVSTPVSDDDEVAVLPPVSGGER